MPESAEAGIGDVADGFTIGEAAGEAFMDWAEDYDGGNPVLDAIMDWIFLEYQDEFGSNVGDHFMGPSDIA